MIESDNKYLLYILLVYLIFSYNFYNLKNEKVKILLGIIPMGILLATQVNIGTDYYNYIEIYVGKTYLPYSRGVIFRYLLDILIIFFQSPRALFVSSAIIQSVLMYKILVKLETIEKIDNIILFIYLLVTTSSWYLMMFNGLRNSIASLFIVFSILLLLENKIFKSFFAFILGIGFHPSVVICFVIYPLKNILLKKKNIKIMIFIFIGCYFLNNLQVIQRLAKFIYDLNIDFPYRDYLISKHMFPYNKTYGIATVIQLFFYLISLVFYKNEEKKHSIFLYNLGYLTFSIGLLFNNIPIFMRTVTSFTFFGTYVVYKLMMRTFNKNYIYMGLYIFLFYILFFIRTIFLTV